MKYRESLLLASEDVGASGTKTINIDIEKPLSRIEFTFKTTKASNGMSAGAPGNITNIQLVDGSTPLHSLNGYLNQALAYYSRKVPSMDHGQHVNTLSEVDTYALDFGRFLWDPELAFDPRKFSNPQLKITFDEDVSDTSVTANALEVWAYVFEEAEISPMGFLSALLAYDYTCGSANSYEYINLDDTKIIRQILVRAYYAGYEPWYNISEARLDENNEGAIPWNFTDLEMYYRRMKSHWQKLSQEVVLAPGSGGQTYYLPMTDYNAGIAGVGQGGTEEMYMTAASARGGKFQLAVTTGVNIAALAWGYLPWHCYQFPMGLQDKLEDWYDPTGKKPRLRLRANTGGTNVNGQVVLEQLHRY